MKGVERVEELLLRALPAGEQLHVIEDQDVDPPEALLELAHPVVAQRGDQVVDEGLRREVADLQGGLLLLDLVADGVHQVRLAETHTAVDEERVVVVTGLARDRLRGGMRELVRRPDHEVGERVLGGQLRVERPAVGTRAGKVREELALIARRQLERDVARPDHRGHRLAQLGQVVVGDAHEQELVWSFQTEVRRREIEWTQTRDHMRQLIGAHLLRHALEDPSPQRLERGDGHVAPPPVHSC